LLLHHYLLTWKPKLKKLVYFWQTNIEREKFWCPVLAWNKRYLCIFRKFYHNTWIIYVLQIFVVVIFYQKRRLVSTCYLFVDSRRPKCQRNIRYETYVTEFLILVFYFVGTCMCVRGLVIIGINRLVSAIIRKRLLSNWYYKAMNIFKEFI